jgi:hypothetical protein
VSGSIVVLMDYRSVSFSIFLPPSPFAPVCSSYLPAVGAGKHACTHSSFSIVIPPIFCCLRIGNTFPKRVLIRKKPSKTKKAEKLIDPTTPSTVVAACHQTRPPWPWLIDRSLQQIAVQQSSQVSSGPAPTTAHTKFQSARGDRVWIMALWTVCVCASSAATQQS